MEILSPVEMVEVGGYYEYEYGGYEGYLKVLSDLSDDCTKGLEHLTDGMWGGQTAAWKDK